MSLESERNMHPCLSLSTYIYSVMNNARHEVLHHYYYIIVYMLLSLLGFVRE